MEKVMFILHTYSVGGAERRCVSIANYLASQGVKVKLVLLDVNKMYACQAGSNGLELDIRLIDAPKVNIPVNDAVELVYLLHKGEEPPVTQNITCIPYSTDPSFSDFLANLIPQTDTPQKQMAKKQLLQLEALYINRIHQYVKQFPDYKVVSWMTFVNISTAVALQTLPNEFAFAECTSPDIEFPQNSGFNYLKELFYPRADAAFFQTEEMKAFYRYLPAARSYVIPNPILTELPDPAITHRAKNIVTFCRVEKPKNLELLIHTFSFLHQKHPDYHLHIYGDGSEKAKLVTMVKQLQLEDAILFFGFTPDVHKKVVCDAMFVSTSNREGISNSMIEAMAIGLPTICTDCHGGGARAMIQDGENGLLVPMDDPQALLDAMCRIIENPPLAHILSQNGSKIRNTLSVSNIGNTWKTAVEQPWRK